MKKSFFAFFFFLFCAIVFTYPAIFHLDDMVIGDGGDNYEFLSYQYLVADNLSKFRPPFAHTDVFRYPVGFDLGLGSDGRLFVLIGGILNPVLGGILAFNLLILLTFALNGFFSFLFFEFITGSRVLGLFGGLAYGFSYYALAMGAGYMSYLSIYCFPLTGYLLLQFIKRKKKDFWNILFLGLSFLLIALCSLQYFLVSLGFILIALPIFFLFFYKEIKKSFRPDLTKLFNFFLVFLIFGILFYLFFSQYLIAFFSLNFNDLSPVRDFVPLKSFFLPNKFSKSYLANLFASPDSLIDNIDFSLFFGFIEVALFTFFVFKKKKKNEWFVLMLFLIFWIFSLGTGNPKKGLIFPYHFLAPHYPFRGVYKTERFFVIYYLFFVSGIVFMLKYISKNKVGRILFPLFFLGIFLERLTSSYYLSPTLEENYQKIVVATQGEGVLDIPLVFDVGRPFASYYNLLPFYYQKKIVTGYIHWPDNTPKTRLFIEQDNELTRFACDWLSDQEKRSFNQQIILNHKMLLRLKNNNIKTIVIHKKIFYEEACYKNRVYALLLFVDLKEEEIRLAEKDYGKIKSYLASLPPISSVVAGAYKTPKEEFSNRWDEINLKRIYDDEKAMVYILE